MGGDRSSDFMVSLGVWFEWAADWAVRIGLVVLAASLVYPIIGIFTGQIWTMPAERLPHMTDVMDQFSTATMVAAIVVSVLWAVRWTEKSEEQIGYVLIFSVIVWFGLPLLASYQGKSQTPPMNSALHALLTNWVRTGQITSVTLIWPFLRFSYRQISIRAERKKAEERAAAAGLRREGPKRGKGRPTVLSACWDLPYCRDYLLNICPAFKARRRCWKMKRGCFCDPYMLENLITGVKGTPQNQQNYMRAEVEARNTVMRQRTNKPPCRQCLIFNEHEKLKFDVLSPLTYVASAGLLYFGFKELVQPLWQGIQQFLQSVWSKISFMPQGFDAAGLNDVFGNQVMLYLFAGILYMVLVLTLLKLLELWCFKWKI